MKIAIAGRKHTETGRSFLHDLLASVVVFLVALPLCMGIAYASGAPPERGIVTGIIGGLIVGFLAGSPLQVSGPAAGLSVLILEIVRNPELGLPALGVIVLTGGLLQLVAGLCKLGQWFRAVSPAVIQGMLAGIGVLIIASQLHVMVDDKPKGSGLENLLSIHEAVWKGLVPRDEPVAAPTPVAEFPLSENGEPFEEAVVEAPSAPAHHWAARIGVLTILVIVGWNFLPQRLRIVPAPLIAVVVATAITHLMGLPILPVKLPPSLAQALHWIHWEDLGRLLNGTVLTAAVTVAVVASAETLLCATAVDQLHQGVRTKYDRELAAQGVGNMLCGLVGALPMTGVIVRSATNIQAGARTRLSAIMHGAWLLGLVALLPNILMLIPVSSLAAVLVFTGYKLINVKAIRKLWEYGKAEVLIYAATVTTIVVKDLLTGILVGVALSVIKLVYTFSHLSIRLEEDPANNRTILYLEGAATFIRLPKLAAALEQVPASTELHVHFEQLSYIDHACLDLLMNWEKQHESTGGSLVIDWESLKARFSPNGRNGQPNGWKPETERLAS